MEVRMQPRSDETQVCRHFQINTVPRARIRSYPDYLGNSVHTFDIPGRHVLLTITTDALVETSLLNQLPESLGDDAWHTIDQFAHQPEYWDYLQPSAFTGTTPLLRQLMDEFQLQRQGDPLQLVRTIKRQMYDTFAYAPDTTHVHSPIDDALRARKGVCQDFAHIMIALVRSLGIPCRYVSGYLYHRREDHDRSEEDASHAWVEVLLPQVGWVGLDPTNRLVVGERHIRVAIGRDYADVPPTRGVYKGTADNELDVSVRVSPSDLASLEEEILPPLGWSPPNPDELEQQQYQQQQ
jgi:transglutaminase-like putative cysteine protease